MRCPYCLKNNRDMPVHLAKNPKCHEKHKSNLSLQLKAMMSKEKIKSICVWCGVDAHDPDLKKRFAPCSAPDGDGHLFKRQVHTGRED